MRVDCVGGGRVIHEEGRNKGGLDCGWGWGSGWRGYSRHSRMARPAHTHTPVVIFISDIFGVDLVNTKLLADEWAGAGWKVLLPDFLEGDAVGHEHLKVGRVRGPNASAGGPGFQGGRSPRSRSRPGEGVLARAGRKRVRSHRERTRRQAGKGQDEEGKQTSGPYEA